MLLLIASCASTGIDYRYYTIHPEVDRLYAKDIKDDLPLLESCKPDAQDQAKCIGMFTPEFFKMKQELLELRESLNECQRGSEPK